MKRTVTLLLVLLITGVVYSQDTLPNFTLTERGGKATVSWTNPYESLVQLNVQRSYDSLKNFTTIYSANSPELPQNGFTDPKVRTAKVFYRIFYVLEGGSYFFSRAKRADGTEFGSVQGFPSQSSKLRDNTPDFANIVPGDKRMVTVKVRDEVVRQLSINSFKNFRDSVLHKTLDSLFSINDSLVVIRPFVAKEDFRASMYVYLNKDGYVNISLPAIAQKKYNLKFFEEDGSQLFEINNVKESPLLLDKATFIHGGWFIFELYEDNRLKEKNKLYLPKDF